MPHLVIKTESLNRKFKDQTNNISALWIITSYNIDLITK